MSKIEASAREMYELWAGRQNMVFVGGEAGRDATPSELEQFGEGWERLPNWVRQTWIDCAQIAAR